MAIASNARIEKVFPALLILATLFFSTYRITESPPVWYDEGFYNQAALNWMRTGEQGLQIAPEVFASASNSTVGFPLIYPVSVVFKYFGAGVLQARAVMVFFIVALVLLSYVFTRRMFGARFAMLASMLLATFPVLYGNGKSMLGEVPGLFFFLLFLLALSRIEKNNFNGTLQYLFAGLFAGLCVATKPIFLLVLPAVCATLFFQRKSIAFHWKQIGLAAVAFFVPIFVWLVTQFKASDSVAQIISYYANPYEVTDLTSVIFGNITRFVTELSPLYALCFFLVWAVSMYIRARVIKKNISVTESIAIIFSLLVFVFYLRTPGWYRYFFPAVVMSIVYAPYAIYTVVSYFKMRTGRFVGMGAMTITASIILIVSALHLYQLGFDSWVAEHYDADKTATLTRYFEVYNPSTSFFIYDVPEVVLFLPSDNYYQYIQPHKEKAIGKEEIQKIYEGAVDEIIITATAYKEKKDGFTLYKEKDRVDAYIILEKNSGK